MAHKRNSVEVPELEKLLAGKKKKYVRYEEGAVLYSMGKNSFRQVAQDAHAVVRLKRIALVNVEVLDEYLESTKMESVEQVADAEGMLSEVASAADSMIYRLDVCFEHYPEFLKNPKIRQKVVGLLQKAKDYIVKLEGEFAYD